MPQLRVPPLVGRKEAARILGMPPTNLTRNLGDELPPPLQERQEGIEVSQTPLWLTGEIEELARWREDQARVEERLRAAVRREREDTTNRVLAALSANWQPGRDIAAVAGVSERGIGRRLKLLEGQGLVEAKRDRNGHEPLLWRRVG